MLDVNLPPFQWRNIEDFMEIEIVYWAYVWFAIVSEQKKGP